MPDDGVPTRILQVSSLYLMLKTELGTIKSNFAFESEKYLIRSLDWL